MDNQDININEDLMLEEIRDLLSLSIEDFVYQMNWPNSKYYDYIKNGRKRGPGTEKIRTRPTIKKVFVGINYAIANFNNWKSKKILITNIVLKYLMVA